MRSRVRGEGTGVRDLGSGKAGTRIGAEKCADRSPPKSGFVAPVELKEAGDGITSENVG
jgi:hypothetical protein